MTNSEAKATKIYDKTPSGNYNVEKIAKTRFRILETLNKLEIRMLLKSLAGEQ